MILSHIVAVARNGVIGKDNGLPWDIPEDMKFFKEKTKGKCLIMGRKTFESVGHPLPNRMNVVVTAQNDYLPRGAVVQPCLDGAIEYSSNQTSRYGDEVFIIGGEKIFRDSMDKVDLIYLTRIHRDFDGDVFYPDMALEAFEEVERRDRSEPVPFSFLTYHRKSKP